MNETAGREHRARLKLSILAVSVVGTAMLAVSLIWNLSRLQSWTLEEARIQARVAYERDILYRRWNSNHGGVYVKVTDKYQPNPYLEGFPKRDLLTEDGTKLTLINPAYMTRQAHEMSEDDEGVKGHLTSEHPIRPGNAPDEWEKYALNRLREGAAEVSSLEMMDGSEFMRLMKPLFTEEGCIHCHPDSDYFLGGVQGGLAVAVPMGEMRSIEARNTTELVAAHAALWFIGIAGLMLGGKKLLKSEQARNDAERQVREYAREMEESFRLKDLFVDIMRHDLLNPAAVVKCYIDFLAEGEQDSKRLEFCTKIRLVNDKLIQMINSASKYSSLREMERIETEHLELGQVVRESTLSLEDRIREQGMEIEFPPEGKYPVNANPMIGDIFTNLIANAVKYANTGGKISVEIDDRGGSWVVRVRDFGPGIADKDKGKIFNRFERLEKGSVKGTGLGLAIAKRLVDLHAGEIWVEDNPGGGCVFIVRLPKGDVCGEEKKGDNRDGREA